MQIDGAERLIIPLSRRTDPAFIHASVLFYRVVERVTSQRSAVQRVLLVSPRGVIYLCYMDGRVTHTVHCFELKWIRIIEKPSSILVWCTNDNVQTMISFRADHISNVPVCVLGYFVQVLQSFAPDLRANSEEAMKANLNLDEPANIWTRMLQGVRKIRKLDLDEIATISQPTSQVMTETVDDTLLGVANDDDDDENGGSGRKRRGGGQPGDSDDEILGLSDVEGKKGGNKKRNNESAAPPLVLSDSFSDHPATRENSNVVPEDQTSKTSSNRGGLLDEDDQFLKAVADQQNNNRARTPLRKNMTDQHLDHEINDESGAANNSVSKNLLGLDRISSPLSSSSHHSVPQQQQLFSTLRITKASEPAAFKHHLNSNEGSALQIYQGCKFQLSSFYFGGGGGGDTGLGTMMMMSGRGARGNTGNSGVDDQQRDILFHEIKEAAFPNARDFSLALSRFGGSSASNSAVSPYSSSVTRNNKAKSNNNQNVASSSSSSPPHIVIISGSWDEPTILNHQSKADKRKQIFDYYQKLTNRFIRKLQEFYPGIIIKTGSSASQELMQLTAHVNTLNRKLGDLHRQTHKLVNEIVDDEDEEEDENEDEEDPEPGSRGFLIAQQKALNKLIIHIIAENGKKK